MNKQQAYEELTSTYDLTASQAWRAMTRAIAYGETTEHEVTIKASFGADCKADYEVNSTRADAG